MAKKSPLQRAFEAAGENQSKLADMIGTSQQNISNWLRFNRPLPAEYVIAAEKATGIPRHEWRPDVYPVERGEAA